MVVEEEGAVAVEAVEEEGGVEGGAVAEGAVVVEEVEEGVAVEEVVHSKEDQ